LVTIYHVALALDLSFELLNNHKIDYLQEGDESAFFLEIEALGEYAVK